MIEFLGLIYQTAIGHFWEYNGQGFHIGLFYAAILYLIAAKKEEEDKPKKLIVGYSILFAILYLCPVTAYMIMDYCIGVSVYWRMFWLLPINITIAYVFVKWLFQANGKFQFALFVAAAVFIIVVCGKPVYTEANFYPSENQYKIPQNAIDVCEFIEADYTGNEVPKVTVPNEMLCYIRQYDAGIHMPYGRNALKGQKLGKNETKIYEMMTNGQIDWGKMTKLLKKEDCDYFVYLTGIGEVELADGGYIKAGEINGYSIYRCKNVE